MSSYVGTTKVFTGLKGDPGDGVIIRFSSHADGTNFTSVWEPGQYYIGFTTGKVNNTPVDKTAYTWAKFVAAPGDVDTITFEYDAETTTLNINTPNQME